MKPSDCADVMQIPNGYTVMSEDAQLVNGRAFYIPGSTKDSWNKITPVTRILVRNDKFIEVCTPVTLPCFPSSPPRNPAHLICHPMCAADWECGFPV